jgi:integrase
MSIYKRGKIWWYKFIFANRLIRESTKTSLKTLAQKAEMKRKRELEEGYNAIVDKRNERVRTLRQAAEVYSVAYAARNRKKSVIYSEGCVKHLNQHLGDKMLIEITDQVIQAYQLARLKEGAAGKTINEEVGELLRIMAEAGDILRLKLKKNNKLRLKERQNVGRALSPGEEADLLQGAKNADSPMIYPAVVLALNTTMRDDEIKKLQWRQFNFQQQILTVGKSKTDAGEGRTIPLNSALVRVILDHKIWYEARIGTISPDYYVFPFGRSRHWDPTKPITTFKTAWQNLKKRTGIQIRFHDLRHTVITKLAEEGAPDETIRAIAGHVSKRMLTHYSHIRTEFKRKALEAVATKLPEQNQSKPKLRRIK